MPGDDEGQPRSVRLIRLVVPFWQLVWFLVRLSFASAIAFVVTSALWIAIFLALGMALATLGLGLGSVKEWLSPSSSPSVPALWAPPPSSAPGWLILDLPAGKGLSARIDGDMIGAMPSEGFSLPPGPHMVVFLDASGRDVGGKAVTITSGETVTVRPQIAR